MEGDEVTESTCGGTVLIVVAVVLGSGDNRGAAGAGGVFANVNFERWADPGSERTVSR